MDCFYQNVKKVGELDLEYQVSFKVNKMDVKGLKRIIYS